MSPKFGFAIRFLSMSPGDEVFKAVAASRRLDTLELCPEIFDQDQKGTNKASLKKRLKEGGLRAETFHARFGAESDFSALDKAAWLKAIKNAEDAIEMAVEFGASIMVVHASSEPIPAETRAKRIEQSRKALDHLAGRCTKLRIKVAVEFLPRTCLGNSVEELLELAGNHHNHVLGVCLDVNHLMSRYAELPDYVRRLGSRLHSLHLSDCDKTDEKHWFPGKGVIDWKALMAALREVNFNGPMTYECVPDGNTLEEKVQSLDKNIAWLSSL